MKLKDYIRSRGDVFIVFMDYRQDFPLPCDFLLGAIARFGFLPY